jgi:hypothetical protein
VTTSFRLSDRKTLFSLQPPAAVTHLLPSSWPFGVVEASGFVRMASHLLTVTEFLLHLGLTPTFARPPGHQWFDSCFTIVAVLLNRYLTGEPLSLPSPKTSYVRKELYTASSSAVRSPEQRNKFVRDLYAIPFTYVVEGINRRPVPSPEEPAPRNQIAVFNDVTTHVGCRCGIGKAS